MDTKETSFRLATRADLRHAVLLTGFLGPFLAYGFIPTAQEIGRWLAHWFSPEPPSPHLAMIFFPGLAGFFYFSLPRKRSRFPRCEKTHWFGMSILPIVLAAAYGAIRNPLPFSARLASLPGDAQTFWNLLCIPVGEELLFRGWTFEIAEQLWPRKFATATNPLPLCVWVSAATFSLWHLQNLGSDAAGWVWFQIGYTLFTGLWLGILRFRTGSLTLCMLNHAAINLATG